MLSDVAIFHRRHLPHLFLPNAVYFTTFRLAGSLPKHAIESLPGKARLQRKERISHVDYDKALEKSVADVHWMARPQIADLVAETIRYRDGKDYDLATYCILPNHVHLVFGIGKHEMFGPVGQIANLSNKELSKIMQSLKRYTATRANEILRRSGEFWQDESYDHMIRNEAELEKIVKYVAYNPVKAGLVKNWRDWKWTYTIFDVC